MTHFPPVLLIDLRVYSNFICFTKYKTCNFNYLHAPENFPYVLEQRNEEIKGVVCDSLHA